MDESSSDDLGIAITNDIHTEKHFHKNKEYICKKPEQHPPHPKGQKFQVTCFLLKSKHKKKADQIPQLAQTLKNAHITSNNRVPQKAQADGKTKVGKIVSSMPSNIAGSPQKAIEIKKDARM